MERLRVASTGRTLETESGKPFFWLGDTAWEIFHRLTREEVLAYLESRHEHDFNVLMGVALAELDGIRSPNAYGHLPLVDEDPTKLNEAYWEHVDWVIDHAALKGIYVGLLPTWGDKVFKMWGAGPVLFNEENGRAYGRLVAERYRHADSVFWINGGDRPGNENKAVWNSIAAGLREGDGARKRLMTCHPVGESSSSKDFHTEAWLDFNMIQTSHGRHECRPDEFVSKDYDLEPVKPTLDGEPRYENHPVFTDGTLPYYDADDVRRAIYLGVFAGGCGATYGCHAMWQFASEKHEPINYPVGTWKESLDLPGVRQLRHLKALMEMLRFHELIPDQAILADRNWCMRALRARDWSRAAVYVAPGMKPPVKLNLPEGKWTASWFRPSDGKTEKSWTLEGREASQPTWAKRDADWVLVLAKG